MTTRKLISQKSKRQRWKRYALALFAAACVRAVTPAVNAQTTIVVNSTAQEATLDNLNGITNGNCTLGEAILAANAGSPVDACTFAGSGLPYTIVLPNQQFTMISVHNWWYGPNALPPIASTIIIQGNGATLQVTDPTIVRLRFFYVGANAQAPGTLGFNTPGAGQLTLENLTLTGGRQQGGNSYISSGGGAGMGGAIFNQGSLQLFGVTMTGNTATGGSSTIGPMNYTGGGGGGGMGQDATSSSAGGFGGPVTPAGSAGGAGFLAPPPLLAEVGGGGGGFNPGDNGQSNETGNGGGVPDGMGGSGGWSSGTGGMAGHGSGGGANSALTDDFCLLDANGGGGFGQGGQGCGGGGIGGGGGFDASGTGGGGGFGGGAGGYSDGGFGGGSSMAVGNPGYGGSIRGSGAGMGGAIFNHGGMLTVVNSTLTGNTATGGSNPETDASEANGLGGAIFNLNGSVAVQFSTLAANTVATGSEPYGFAVVAGGAVYSVAYNLVAGQTASVVLSNSILANSIGGTDLYIDQPTTVSSGASNVATASLTYGGANIVMNSSTNAMGTVEGSAPLTADPQLAPLTVNAPGLTGTMAIAATSPATDAGICQEGITTDQRGVTRPQGPACDLGAYEFVPASQTITFTGLPATTTFGSAGPYMLNATASSGLPVSYSVSGPASLNGSTLTVTGAGTVVVTASQAGDTAYAPAKPVSLTIVVSPDSQTITFASISAQSVGSKLALTATASSGLPVSFASTTPSVCSVSGTTATMLSAGTCSIVASQGGNTQYAAAAPVTRSFSVNAAQSFTIKPTPATETAVRGVLAAFALQITSVNGFSGKVALSCSGGPAGAVCADLPQTVTVKGTAYALSGMVFPKTTPPGMYTVTFTGKSGSLIESATATFKVQ